MSFYPRQYPVLEKTRFTLSADDFIEGVSPLVDAGQAVQWRSYTVTGGKASFRFRNGETEERCLSAPWSEVADDGIIRMTGSGQTHVIIAATRFLQLMIETHESFESVILECGLIPPAPVSPMDHQISQSPSAFYWTRVEGAEDYDIQISKDKSFAECFISVEGIGEEGYLQSRTLEPGRWHWRVRARYGPHKTEWSRPRVFEIDPAFHISLRDADHPRLFFKADELSDIRRKVLTDPRIDWLLIRETADAALEYPLVDEKDVLLMEGQHSGFHELAGYVARGQLEPLAFAYLITQNEVYAAKAREVMLCLCGFSRWTGVPFGTPKWFYPVWQAALETAGICKGVATAYDWIYDYLSEEDRIRIREGLLRLGILPLVESWANPATIRYIPRHQVAAGNWWSVCNSGAGIAALAVMGEEPGAGRWVEMAANAIRWYLTYAGGDAWNIDLQAGSGGQCLMWSVPNWGEDGGYVESLGYVNYGMVNALYFIDALKRTTGADISKSINPKLLDQLYYCLYKDHEGRMRSINFNDSTSMNLSSDLYALLARHTGSGKAQWLLSESCETFRTIHTVLAYDPSVPKQEPDLEERNKLFSDIGWGIFRSGWKRDDSLLAVKYKYGRGHEDIGQYVIHYKGRPMVIDPGVISYADPIYRQFLSTSLAHNLVLVDGERQVQADGKITAFCQASGIGYIEGDLTAAYPHKLDRWTRGFVWLEPDTVVVLDYLDSPEPRQYMWQIHPADDFEVIPGEGVLLKNGDVRMQVKIISPLEWNWEILDGYIGRNQAGYIGIRPKKETACECFAAVFTGLEVGGFTAKIESAASSEGASVRVHTHSAAHLVSWRKDQGRLDADQVDADARVCALTFDPAGKDLRRFLITEGTRLMNGTQTLYESDTPSHFAADLSKEKQSHL